MKGVGFSAAYTSDMSRAIQTAELILQVSENVEILVQKDIRLREWCLGSMEAENNAVFIKNISDWLGGVASLAELNGRTIFCYSKSYAECVYGYCSGS